MEGQRSFTIASSPIDPYRSTPGCCVTLDHTAAIRTVSRSETHDFSALSSYDFELLCADLLGRDLDLRLETFTPGPDGGVDLRHLHSADNSLVVQCKHWLKSGWSSLKSHLENDEAETVRNLSPDRYMVATSVPMTPDRKAVIYSFFADFMESPADVYGPEDLNGLLRASPEIEQSHFPRSRPRGSRPRQISPRLAVRRRP